MRNRLAQLMIMLSVFKRKMTARLGTDFAMIFFHSHEIAIIYFYQTLTRMILICYI